MYFWECVKYVAIVSFSGFVFGLILPQGFFKESKFPFKDYKIEEEGKLYEKLKIRKWKNKLPDMSRMFPWLMTEKSLSGKKQSREDIYASFSVLIKETCKAEFVHILLCIAGLKCIKIWSGLGGVVCCLLNIMGNLPFIMIQRYNRPRFVAMVNKLSVNTQESEDLQLCHASANSDS